MAIKVEACESYKFDKKFAENPMETDEFGTFKIYNENRSWCTVINGPFPRVKKEAIAQYRMWFKTDFGKLIVVSAKK